MTNPYNPLKRYTVAGLTLEEFSEKCKKLIEKEGRFLGKSEISRLLGIPRSTIFSAGVDTDDYSKELGFNRSRLKPKGNSEDKADFIAEIEKNYVSFIREQNRCISLYEFLMSFCDSSSKVSRYYRYGLNPKKCHELANVKFIENYGLDFENAEISLRKMICEKRRYITTLELAMELGVSRSLFDLEKSKEKLNIQLINYEYGFSTDGKSFEMLIAEYLQELYPEDEIIMQKSFDDLRSENRKANGKLRYDFFIERLSLLIEVDGPGHWDPNCHYYSDEVIRRDNLKNKYAEDNGYFLIRIRYNGNYTKKDLEEVISGIPLKLSVGQPAAKPENFRKVQRLSERSRVQVNPKRRGPYCKKVRS